MNVSEHTTSSTRPATLSARFKLGITSCVLTPNVPITVACQHATLAITGDATTAGKTPAVIGGMSCDIRLGVGTTSTCHVIAAGTMGVSYTNSTHLLEVDQFHTNVNITGSPSGCVFPNGASTRLQTHGGANLTYDISPAVSINATMS